MPILITCLIIMLNSIIYLKNRTLGLTVYCILALTYPLTSIMNMSISYEILGMSVVVFFEMSSYLSGRKFVWYKSYWIVIGLIISYFFATYYAAMYTGGEVQIVTFLGKIRLCILLFMFTQNACFEKNFPMVLKVALVINMIAILLQVYMPGAANIFLKLYQKGNEGVLSIVVNQWEGVFRRCFGTFHTPTLLGYLALVSTIYFLYELFFEERKKTTGLFLSIAIIAGFASSMKMYYVTLFVCVCVGIIGVIFYRFVLKRNIVVWDRKKTRSFLLTLIVCAVISQVLNERGVFVNVYILNSFSKDTITHGWEQRFEEEGMASIEMDMERPIVQSLIGVGATKTYGKMIKDSQWLYSYWYYGILGTIAIVGWLVWKVIVYFKQKNCKNLEYILMTVLAGVITTNLNQFIGIFVLAYIAKNQSGMLTDTEEQHKGV